MIYRFITQELFQVEMENIELEGMVHGFIYEEFHPNHDYDLRRKADNFIKSVLEGKWNEQFDRFQLAEAVTFRGIEYNHEGITVIILAFQETHSAFRDIHFEIEKVTVDAKALSGSLKGRLVYEACLRQGEAEPFDGECEFHFIREWDDWSISEFRLPGFGDR